MIKLSGNISLPIQTPTDRAGSPLFMQEYQFCLLLLTSEEQMYIDVYYYIVIAKEQSVKGGKVRHLFIS